MARDELGPWKPLGLNQVVGIFDKWPRRWWVSGGLALELCMGSSWRTHEDTDVGVLRHDVAELASVLADWDIQVAAAGTLPPWDGSELSADAHQNNMWCRTAPDQPWCLDLTVNEGDRQFWISRRDPGLKVPWDDAVLRNHEGIPYLEPVLQLLYKSKNNRPKDDQDASQVIPNLAAEQRGRFRTLLPADHPWQALLARPESDS